MKKLICSFLIFFLLITLVSCNESESQPTKVNPFGKALKIGVIGKIPNVKEEQVKFMEIKFSDLENQNFDSNYDAVFITKDNLSEAAQDKYAPIYKKSKIPFFFFQSNKTYIPFVTDNLSYEDAPVLDDNSYAIGIISNGDSYSFWGYGLYNGIENQINIQDIYSRIFETIHNIQMPK